MNRDEKGDNPDITPAWRDKTLLERTYIEASRAGMRGVTWYEIAKWLDVHHGHASGALSTLHKQQMLHRLTETRGNCAIYVVGSCVGKRDTIPYGGRPKEPEFFIEKLWEAFKREGVPRVIEVQGRNGGRLGVVFEMPQTGEEVRD